MSSQLGRRKRTGPHERGASLVEFAFVAPLLVMLVLGLVTGGITLSRKNSMTNAVREGARFGATLPNATTWADAVVARTVQASTGDLTTSEVCAKLVFTPSTTVRVSTGCAGVLLAEEPPATAIPANECIVKVWARRGSEFQYLFASQTITLEANAVSRFERGASSTCS